MSLLPEWAPNLHPLLIHFPIGLLLAAASLDLGDALLRRPPWLGIAGTSLYVAGTVAAVASYLTGLQAASTVLVPGMAHPVLNDHRNWALITTVYFAVVSTARVAARFAMFPRTRRDRLLLLATGVVGVVLLQQTAERGARLVYEFGIGVIGVPGPR
jgi:uncharacterized membrane protein